AYCAALPKRAISEESRGDEPLAGFTCTAPPSEDDESPPRSCPDVDFTPAATGGVVREARLLSIHFDGQVTGGFKLTLDRCLLGWRTPAGWFYEETALTLDNERHYNVIVALRPVAAPSGHGVVARARLRWVNHRRDGDGDPHPDCYDTLALYGVGASGALSIVSIDVGQFDDCGVIVWDGHPQPPSRWDQYFEDKLLPDGTLRLRRVGRHIKHSSPDARAGDHALVFP
ncbi:MAG TPA: hypothetical protein VIA18_22130, partial [Polyangia bacterium]|nr:hypothetical protein [Polyangia bacterium]